MTERSEDPRVDALRQQLLVLGYLDAGVDRFVLGGARETRRPAAIAWLAGVRIGAISAVLIGPAAAMGAALRLPGLVTGPRDAFVVAAYMGIVFGAAVCVAAFVASMAAAWIAKRTAPGAARGRRRVAVGAGAVITVASLAYLTLWWDASQLRAESGAFAGRASSPFVTAGALAYAAAISLLLGHLVTVAALAVTMARGSMAGELRGVPGTSRKVLSVAGLLAFCGALLLFNLTTRSEGLDGGAVPLTVVPSGLRVTLLAVDGFDLGIAERLTGQGRIPALGAALALPAGVPSGRTDLAEGQSLASREPQQSAPATRRRGRATLDIEDTRDPARFWTTVATGQPPAVHAVRGLETRRVVGLHGTLSAAGGSPFARTLGAATDLVRLTRPSIVSGGERRAKTLWEVASEAGLRSVVVNWWATWPAPAGAGVIVSDRATLRLDRGGDLDAEIAPPDVYQMLRAKWPALRAAAAEEAASIRSIGEAQALLRRSAELDALQLLIAREVAGDDTDLVVTYLPGLDLVQHGLLGPGDGVVVSPSAVADRLAALEEYYVFLDRLLARPLVRRGGDLLILMTSPGRVQASAPGALALRGDAVNDRVRDARALPADIMPTVLHALGVPISRELAGRALIELFSADFARRYPIRMVDTYGSPRVRDAPRGGQPLDREMIDRLRSLGYVR